MTHTENLMPSAQALRPEQILSTFANDPVMAEILPTFIEYLPSRVASMVALLAQQDMTNLSKVVHQVKGSGGSYGFQCLTDSAAVVEASIRQGASLETITSHVDFLIAMMRNVRGYNHASDALRKIQPISK